jgi:hypothetical protein
MYTLVLWAAVAAAGSTEIRDWKPIAQFNTLSACQEAAILLGAGGRYRCLKS